MFVIRERLYAHPVVIIVSSIVLLNPNDNFWVVPLLHSVNGISHLGHELAQLDEALRYKPEGCKFDSRWMLLEHFIDKILPTVLWPWGGLSL